MSVIPLTLTISLCLVFTFVLFFLREHSRQRFSSAESDALLPLADEIPRTVKSTRQSGPSSRRHGDGQVSAGKTGEGASGAGSTSAKPTRRA